MGNIGVWGAASGMEVVRIYPLQHADATVMRRIVTDLCVLDFEGPDHAIRVRSLHPGVSFDEVVQSMMLRANQVNLKFVGSNLMWKDFQAVLGDTGAPRVEVFNFCDIAVGRDLRAIAAIQQRFLDAQQDLERRRAAAEKNSFSLNSSGHDKMVPEKRDGHEGY